MPLASNLVKSTNFPRIVHMQEGDVVYDEYANGSMATNYALCYKQYLDLFNSGHVTYSRNGKTWTVTNLDRFIAKWVHGS